MSVMSEIDTLTRLAREFVVRDIMIPEADLVCSADLPGAMEILARFPDFDMIPIQSTRALKGFVERESSTLMPIRVDDLISEATSILDVRYCAPLVSLPGGLTVSMRMYSARNRTASSRAARKSGAAAASACGSPKESANNSTKMFRLIPISVPRTIIT